MEPIYTQPFTINDNAVDRYGRLKPSMILYYVQEVAGKHFDLIAMDYDQLAERGMIWAIIRQRVQISRIPTRGETIRVETWPMPNTRVAFPRSVIAYDAEGQEVFRSMSLWVLMDVKTRAMVLPAKSGLSVPGTVRGNELAPPGALPSKVMVNHRSRPVCFTDLDRNGHMNNTRYMDWVAELIPEKSVNTMELCYFNEGRLGDQMELSYTLTEDTLTLNIHRLRTDGTAQKDRIFGARLGIL